MQIITKCWTPEWFEAVTHAVLDLDIELLEYLAQRMHVANRLKLEESEFMGLQYDRYDPRFVRVDDAAEIQLREEAFDELSDAGQYVLPASMDNHEWEEAGMRPCVLMVRAGDLVLDDEFKPTGKIRENSGRIYWYGFDKHGGADCRVETYSISPKELHELAGELGFGLCNICGTKLAKGRVVCSGCQDDSPGSSDSGLRQESEAFR